MTSSQDLPSTAPHAASEPPPDAGFEIGWDFAHYRVAPPAEHLMPGSPVRNGWEAGQTVFGVRTLRATPYVRKWLQLRLGAWLRGKTFELVQVTPNFLERIDTPVCPITGETLTQATGSGSDASVDRVNNGAGYAAGNLAVMSTRANKAKAAYDWRDAAGFVRQIEVGKLGQIDGLDARQWARLATLMSYCTPLSHAEAAHLPLLVLPPPRLRLLNPAQAVQASLTLCFARPARAPKVDSLIRAFPAGVHHELRSFLTTLLARRIAVGPAATEGQLKAALEAAWCEPLIIRRWHRVAWRMDVASCEAVAAALPAATFGAVPLRYLDFSQATEGWALATGGLVPSESLLEWSDADVEPTVRSSAGRIERPTPSHSYISAEERLTI
jgi:hypothetical protein